jgi:hypothetical protein
MFLVLPVVGIIAGAHVTPHNPAGSIICGLIGAALALLNHARGATQHGRPYGCTAQVLELSVASANFGFSDIRINLHPMLSS